MLNEKNQIISELQGKVRQLESQQVYTARTNNTDIRIHRSDLKNPNFRNVTPTASINNSSFVNDSPSDYASFFDYQFPEARVIIVNDLIDRVGQKINRQN